MNEEMNRDRVVREAGYGTEEIAMCEARTSIPVALVLEELDSIHNRLTARLKMCAPGMMVLSGASVDVATPEELARIHELNLLLPMLGEREEGARLRVARRRAAIRKKDLSGRHNSWRADDDSPLSRGRASAPRERESKQEDPS